MLDRKPVIQYIPYFLEYCETEGLKENTRENYYRFLKKFEFWLLSHKLGGLLPHQLTIDHITAYKSYLSTPSLKRVTQKYYLIALRAFLAYFKVKSIVSLDYEKIGLPKADKSVKTQNYPSLVQLESLINAKVGTSAISLRNQAVLQTIMATGQKINYIVNLDKTNANELPLEILPIIQEYLNTRTDSEAALFINYSGATDRPRRLSPRMIQRIIKSSNIRAGLPSSITPETLRWAKIIATWNKEIKITGDWQTIEK